MGRGRSQQYKFLHHLPDRHVKSMLCDENLFKKREIKRGSLFKNYLFIVARARIELAASGL
jgi:hypothetical protein